ncbi:TolC family protein [Ferrimonas pelagia]|uniref:TolC family protein n=1 Tax=Ferrimonas pelagia TaxID=1177826 RepID=A0ABP9FEC5_9GAMM
MKYLSRARYWALPLALGFCLSPVSVAAEQAVADLRSRALSESVLTQLEQLPQIQTEAARLKQQQLAVDTASQALYNPELGLEAENIGGDVDIEYSLSLSQGYDRGDKRGLQTRLAQLEAQQALAEFGLLRNEQLAALLTAWVDLDLARQTDAYTEQTQQRTEAMMVLARQMVSVGEIAPLDGKLLQLELARLAASRSDSQRALIQAEAVLSRLGGASLLGLARTQTLALGALPAPAPADRTRLPALQPAYQAVKAARALFSLSQIQAKADPTFSIGASADGNDQSMSVGVSIPLNIRNRFNGEIAQANQGIIIAEQAFLSQQRDLGIELDALRQQLSLYSDSVTQWHALAEGPLQDSQSLLERQWRGGEITTTDYLQSQQQLTDTWASGAELRAERARTWLALMATRGDLELWLQQQQAR